MKAPIIAISGDEISEDNIDSKEINEIPHLESLLLREHIIKKFVTKPPKRITINCIFNRFKLNGIKYNTDEYVNRTLVYWALHQRPYVIMIDKIPSPMTVLRQQSVGTRVLTVFIDKQKLDEVHVAKLYFMEGIIYICNLLCNSFVLYIYI